MGFVQTPGHYAIGELKYSSPRSGLRDCYRSGQLKESRWLIVAGAGDVLQYASTYRCRDNPLQCRETDPQIR